MTGLTLVCSSAPGPLELDLTGERPAAAGVRAAPGGDLGKCSQGAAQGWGRGCGAVTEGEVPPTGDLESFKKQSFVLKEGVEYRIKISFRVSYRLLRPGKGGGAGADLP